MDSTSGRYGYYDDTSYTASIESLCKQFNITERRCDEITEGAIDILSKDLLAWESVVDDIYMWAIRESDDHPDLVILARVDIAAENFTLLWVGPVTDII